jgi:hypothetical protein
MNWRIKGYEAKYYTFCTSLNYYLLLRIDDFLNLPNPSGRTRPWGLLSL